MRLTCARDGFVLPAYRAPPSEARRGGLVVLHALWGVTPHIRALCDSFAAEGYETLAPSLLERWDPGFAAEDIEPARQPARQAAAIAANWGAATVDDIQAAVDALEPPVSILGFCFGGSAAWAAACHGRGVSAVSAFYGGHIVDHRFDPPTCPTILHFGRSDPLIPLSDVEKIEAAQPDVPIWLYDAGHAFVAPSDYQADAASLGLLRSRQLFHRSGGRGESGA